MQDITNKVELLLEISKIVLMGIQGTTKVHNLAQTMKKLTSI